MDQRKIVWIPIAVTLGILLFGFQNCQQPPYQDELNGNEAVNQESARAVVAPPSKQDGGELVKSSQVLFPISLEEVESISFVAEIPVQAERNGRQFTLVDRVEFAFDLQSGRVQAVGSSSNFSQQYCLNATQLSGLLDLLRDKNVCQIERDVPAGTMCTMAIVPGYATLSGTGRSQELGGSNDGCRRQTVDFCENHGQIVKSWFEDFKNNRDSLACQF